MAKKIRKTKLINKPRKNTPKIKVQNGFLNRIKLTESYTSLILGAIVILIVGILFIFLVKGNRTMQTSSTRDTSVGESQDSQTSSIYTVNPGDDLWSISEDIFHDGYKWIEIAKLNNLENPSLIYSGDKLIIPELKQSATPLPQNQNSIVQNSSITGNSYTVVEGDNLWDIAVRAYGDGFKWPEIAMANNLSNPDLIFSGNVFKIPR